MVEIDPYQNKKDTKAPIVVNSRLYTAYHFLKTRLHYVDPSDICHILLSQWLYRSICMLLIVTIDITRWGAHIRVIWADVKWACRLHAPSLSHNLPQGFPQLETSYASIDFGVRSTSFYKWQTINYVIFSYDVVYFCCNCYYILQRC